MEMENTASQIYKKMTSVLYLCQMLFLVVTAVLIRRFQSVDLMNNFHGSEDNVKVN